MTHEKENPEDYHDKKIILTTACFK